MYFRNVVVVIPAKRPAPIKTLVNHRPSCKVWVISDPEVYADHRRWVKEQNFKNVEVKKGRSGLTAQIIHCYRLVKRSKFRYAFRMDDDLDSKTITMRKPFYTDVDTLISISRRCMEEHDVTLVGPNSTSNRTWLKPGYGRSAGHISGGLQMFRVVHPPEFYLDPRIIYTEDVYRVCAHREADGAVGRIHYIGFDKTRAVQNPVRPREGSLVDAKIDEEIILERFAGSVKLNGYRKVMVGPKHKREEVDVPNWRQVGRAKPARS